MTNDFYLLLVLRKRLIFENILQNCHDCNDKAMGKILWLRHFPHLRRFDDRPVFHAPALAHVPVPLAVPVPVPDVRLPKYIRKLMATGHYPPPPIDAYAIPAPAPARKYSHLHLDQLLSKDALKPTVFDHKASRPTWYYLMKNCWSFNTTVPNAFPPDPYGWHEDDLNMYIGCSGRRLAYPEVVDDDVMTLTFTRC
jgi:hypothetical protein